MKIEISENECQILMKGLMMLKEQEITAMRFDNAFSVRSLVERLKYESTSNPIVVSTNDLP